MAIKRRYDPVHAIGQLSVLAGKAEAQQKQAAIDREMALRTAQMQHQKEMAKFEADMRFKYEQQAQEWEYQKMALRSQNDFLLQEERHKALYMRELAKQLKEMDEYDQAKKQITNLLADKEITEDEANRAMANIELKYVGYAGVLPRAEKPQNEIQAAMARLISETTDMETPAGGRVRVVSPQGQTGTIEASEVAEYEAKGFKVIGEIETPTKKPQLTEAEARARVERYYHPSVRRFLTQSPLRTAIEIYKAK